MHETELFLVGRVAQEEGAATVLARCHAGEVRLGQTLTQARDPAGRMATIMLTVMEIRITKTRTVDMIGTNWGGQLKLAGAGAELLDDGWTLYGDEAPFT